MTGLTRNESASLFQEVWATVVERAPKSTKDIRLLGVMYYISTCNVYGMHTDHYKWLVTALGSDKVLDAIDELARVAREAAADVEIDDEVDSPWRD